MNESKLSNVTKEELENLIFEEKLSYEEIGRKYEVSGGAIKKKAGKLGIELPKKRDINSNETFNKGKSIKRKSTDSKINEEINSISDSEFIDLVKASTSLKDLSKKLKHSSLKGRSVINNRIKELNIDISHFRKRIFIPPVKKSDKSLISTDRLGNIGESKTLSKFVELQIPVYIPFGGKERADLIAEFNGRLNKIQVKTSEFSKNEKIVFKLTTSSRSGKRHTYSSNEIDYFALYNFQEDILILIPFSEVEGKTSVTFRISSNITENNKILNWQDFLFEKICLSV